jgi:glycosyltransferase involved in cell wall biosynthesis
MTLSVCVVQSVIPHYRVPFFEALARSGDIRLTVAADRHPKGSLAEIGVSASDVFEVRDAPLRSIGPFVRQNALREIAEDPAYDVVVLSWDSRFYQLGGAVRRARREGKAVVLWGHGFGTRRGTLARLLGDWSRNRLITRAHACVLYGPTARAALVSRGFPPDRLFVAPNAIDQTPIDAAVERWSAEGMLSRFQQEEGIEGNQLVLFMARLLPAKRPDMLVRAFGRVKDQCPEAKLVFLGDGEMRPRLEGLAVDVGCSDSVIFLGTEYAEDRIAPWALSSVCVVQPEALGLTVLHAYGYGLPMVTSDGLSRQMPEAEVVIDGVNGLLYRDGSVDDLADKISALLGDTALRADLSRGAFATVRGDGARTLRAMTDGFLEGIGAARAFAHKR